LLLCIVVALSLADLYMTLEMLTGVGFAEENPVARAIIALGSPALLAAWKLGTVGFAVWLFIKLRRHAAAEVGCWAGLLIMAGVMFHWHLYVGQTDTILESLPALEKGADARWVAFRSR
jgi:hypothetical protein